MVRNAGSIQPADSGKINIGDHLEGYLEGEKLIDFYIK